jgi:hypothetical protein
VILQLLVEARSLTTVRLRIFITSRPEIPIRHGFFDIPEAEYEDYVLHNISPSIVNHDISIFLEHNLRLIGQERSLDISWPSEEIIRSLVRKASGQFIWAATACRFIRGGEGQFAVKRLGMIIEGFYSPVESSEEHLEAYGEAKFDSGIGSMPDTVSKSKEQDDDNRSIRSILTNASRVLLPPQEEKHLISAFTGDLCQDIVFREDLDARNRISTRLSDLLKNFTLRLEESVNSKTERDAKEFVRQQRE